MGAPMKAMKKAMKKSSAMTASAAYSSVAETTGLKAKEVKAVVEGLVEVAAGELKEWSVQAGGRLEHEAEEEASPACSQGHQPLYQGAVPFQGQASVQDRACSAYEEA